MQSCARRGPTTRGDLRVNTTDSLLERALQGEEAAFTSLYEWFSGRLERTVRERIGGRVASRLEPKDVVQKVFAEVFTRITRVKACGKGTFFRLLVTIARRRVIDVDRHLATRLERAVPTPGEDVPGASGNDVLSRQPGPLTALLRSEERELCRSAFEDLPAKAREILGMRLVEERSVREIGEMTGKSAGAIWVWFQRALRAWAEKLEERRGK